MASPDNLMTLITGRDFSSAKISTKRLKELHHGTCILQNSSSSFVIRVILRHLNHPRSGWGLLLPRWCFSILAKYFEVSFNFKVILYIAKNDSGINSDNAP